MVFSALQIGSYGILEQGIATTGSLLAALVLRDLVCPVGILPLRLTAIGLLLREVLTVLGMFISILVPPEPPVSKAPIGSVVFWVGIDR
jgi:hypothetical protein